MPDSLLDPVTHQRLIEALPQIVHQSHVPEMFIKTSALGNCDEKDIEFLTNYHRFKEMGVAGYCKVGGTGSSRKLNFMAGALIRNYIDVRVYSLEACIELGNKVNPTVMIVPDFCLDTNDGRPMTGWKVQQVYDFLVTRMSQSKPTIVYAQDVKLIESTFGKSLADFIQTNYIRG